MLYDPKWEKQAKTKADPLSLASLIAWLEQQPPHRTYCYLDNGACLAAQYNDAIGRKYRSVYVHGGTYGFNGGPAEQFDIDLETIAVRGDRTFGAALNRARKLSAKSF